MKIYNNLFEKVIEWENLENSFKNAIKGTGKTNASCKYFFNLENELINIQEELENEQYKPGKYHFFKIYDPKERTIAVAPFKDRVVHHALVEVLKMVYEPCFIYDSYATRVNKGTHKAICRAQKFLRNHDYYLKMDIEKFFDTVDHDILLNILKRKIRDKKIINLLEKLIRNYPANKGLPIGNLTSQFLANVYLDPFDHFIKEKMRIKGYLRYMDDFVLFKDSNDFLKDLKQCIINYLNDELKLTLQKKATNMHRASHGLNFLGMRIYPGIIRVKRQNRRRSVKKLSKRINLWKEGLIEEEKMIQSLNSIVSHLKYFSPYISYWVPEP